MPVICSQCQAESPTGAKYCTECGQPLSTSSATTIPPDTTAPPQPASSGEPQAGLRDRVKAYLLRTRKYLGNPRTYLTRTRKSLGKTRHLWQWLRPYLHNPLHYWQNRSHYQTKVRSYWGNRAHYWGIARPRIIAFLGSSARERTGRCGGYGGR